jgi:hypothetical protein
MSTAGIDNNLTQALKDLSADWQQAKTYWHDIKSREFEEKFLEHLPHQVARATTVIAELTALLRKVKTDCE